MINRRGAPWRGGMGSSFISQAVHYFPEDAHLHFGIGIMCSKLDQQNRAQLHLQRAFELTPEDIGLYDMLGSLYQTTKDWHSAASVYEQALAIDPDNVRIFFKSFFCF